MIWPLVALSEETHWAFQAPVLPALPEREVRHVWARGAIDAFLLREMRHDGREPNAAAAPWRLLRRLSLDLRGLPVNLAEQDAFEEDFERHSNAVERLIDRWLAAPGYGERMAQDWLDLARYADTTGHAADQPRTMWLYRDWVINVLNEDLPFNQFTLEQLAGDKLPEVSEAQLIATGFHRNSMQALGNNPRKEEFRVRGIVDRLEVTGQVWLGLSLGCAECHDHKHDPISQKEYYQLFAIFNQVPHYGEKFEVHGPRITVTRLVDGQPQEVEAQVMDTVSSPRETHIHLRGNFEMRGERVQPGLPAVLPQAETGGASSSMDRLQFARWLISERHPLTARVTVNRAWRQFFGRGLVATVNDFGRHGSPPTHPRLLDWLALRFREGGWSMKRLHRDLLTSAAYQQSSAVQGKPPSRANRWFDRAARFRLPAETLRDQALAVAGLLTNQLGGPSVFPPQPEGVGQFRDATAGEWEVSRGGDRFRRSLYTFWQRMAPHPAMTTFDAPSREWCTASRSTTNTPLQALAMLNDPAMVEAQEHFAQAIDHLPLSERIRWAFRRALAREPDPSEEEKWDQFLRRHPARERSRIMAAVLFNLDEFLTRE